MLRDAAAMDVPLAEQFLGMTTRPSAAREEQVNKNIRVWLHEHADRNRKTSCPTLLPAQVRELVRATRSRAARNAIRSNYVQNETQWGTVCHDYSNFIISQSSEEVGQTY